MAEIVLLLQGEPWPLPLRRDLLSQASAWADISPPLRMGQSLGLTSEEFNLNVLGLPQEAINTIHSAIAPSNYIFIFSMRFLLFNFIWLHVGDQRQSI